MSRFEERQELSESERARLMEELNRLIGNVFGSSFLVVLDFYARKRNGAKLSSLLFDDPKEAYELQVSFFKNESAIRIVWETLAQKVRRDTNDAGEYVVDFLTAMKSGSKETVLRLITGLIVTTNRT